jgi:hypothetical protein
MINPHAVLYVFLFFTTFSSVPGTAPAVVGSSTLLISVPEQPHREFAGVGYCLRNSTFQMRVKKMMFSRENLCQNVGTSFLGRYPETTFVPQRQF